MMATAMDKTTHWIGEDDPAMPTQGEGENIVLYEEEIEDQDPLVTLMDNEMAAIYTRLLGDQWKIYRELVQHYWQQMGIYGMLVPTYKEVRSILRESFLAIPLNDAEILATRQLELLEEE